MTTRRQFSGLLAGTFLGLSRKARAAEPLDTQGNRQVILPGLCLGLNVSAWLSGMVRNSVVEVLDEPFITTLRGKGLRERQILATHVLRNALIPVVTTFGLLAGERCREEEPALVPIGGDRAVACHFPL